MKANAQVVMRVSGIADWMCKGRGMESVFNAESVGKYAGMGRSAVMESYTKQTVHRERLHGRNRRKGKIWSERYEYGKVFFI